MDEYKKTIQRIRENPQYFFEEMLGCQLWEKQLEICTSVRDNKRTAVRSANTVGKSYASARIALWFLCSHYPSVVVTTAPTHRQMKDILWREIHQAYATAKTKMGFDIGGALNQTSFTISADHYAVGVAYRDGETAGMETLQGYHSENILLIADEASAVPKQVFEAFEGGLNAAGVGRLLMIGNPTRTQGEFADAFKSPLYHKIKISAYDTPNVRENKNIIPSLVSADGVREMIEKYGEDSDICRVRVHGDFPLADEDTKIPLHLIEDALNREEPLEKGHEERIGLDVARFGSDTTVFVHRKGYEARVLAELHKRSTMETVGRAIEYLRKYPNADLHIDIIGVGAGVFDRLREMDEYADRVFGVNVASKPSDTEHFSNLRAETWETMRQWLKVAKLHPHDRWTELAQPTYKIMSSGKEKLEEKSEMKKRGVQSPDIADALALTMSEPTEGGASLPIWI